MPLVNFLHPNINHTELPLDFFVTSLFSHATKTLKLLHEVQMSVSKRGFYLLLFRKTENIDIKGRVTTVETMFVNFIRLEHAGKYIYASSRLSKLNRKFQGMLAEKKKKSKMTVVKKRKMKPDFCIVRVYYILF